MFEWDRLCKRFGDKQVLDELSLQVRPGEIYGFCGANGAGKTTAMRIALGVITADSGEVRHHGVAVDDRSRRRIGYMPEERGLYAEMRPRDQLAYFARLSGMPREEGLRRADELLERLGVKHQRKDVLGKLSLGNQQKVQLIAALIHAPDVLVLDEPFSGLDPIAVDAMAEVLVQSARDGACVVFSSHQLDLVERLCDRVGIIRGGTLVAEGAVGQLRRDRASRRLRVGIEGGGIAWAEAVPGATVVDTDGGIVTFDVAGEGAAADILDAARRGGELTHFAWQEPSLADIFREAVAA